MTLSFLAPAFNRQPQICLSEPFIPSGEHYTLVFKWSPQISLSHTRNDRMIRGNILKSLAQHLTYRPRHLVDVRQPEGDRERAGLSRQIKKKRERSKERTALNGFSTLYYEDISHLFLFTSLTCADTLRSPRTCLPVALSLSPFITLTESVQHRALQMFSLPQAHHTLTFLQTSLIIILAVIELRNS